MKKDLKENLNNLFDLHSKIVKILHIPCLSLLDYHELEDFEEFLSIASCEAVNDDLMARYPASKDFFLNIRNNNPDDVDTVDMIRFLLLNSPEIMFLVELQTAKISNIEFNDQGEVNSYTSGGVYVIDWVLADNMDGAIAQCVDLAQRHYDNCVASARAKMD